MCHYSYWETIHIKSLHTTWKKQFYISYFEIKYWFQYILNKYNKTLEQRNNYLKQIKYENKPYDMLDIWDEQLVDLGTKIFIYRKEFIEKINNKILY